MGIEDQSNPREILRRLAAAQGVSPTDGDLDAVQAFLAGILPELERLESPLGPEDELEDPS